MKNLVGCECRCVFNLPTHEWPIKGNPAWVVIVDVDMPMVCIRSSHTIYKGSEIWVNAATFKTIDLVKRPEKWKSIDYDEIRAEYDAMPGGEAGFIKEWGYVQFAHAIEAVLRRKNESQLTEEKKRIEDWRDEPNPLT